jgi:type IV secretory pathway TrbD component
MANQLSSGKMPTGKILAILALLPTRRQCRYEGGAEMMGTAYAGLFLVSGLLAATIGGPLGTRTGLKAGTVVWWIAFCLASNLIQQTLR